MVGERWSETTGEDRHLNTINSLCIVIQHTVYSLVSGREAWGEITRSYVTGLLMSLSSTSGVFSISLLGSGKKKEGNKCCVVQCCSTKVYRGIKGSLLKKESSEDKRGTNSAETTCFLVQQGSIKPIEQVNPLRLINVIGSHFLVRESRSELRPFLACE